MRKPLPPARPFLVLLAAFALVAVVYAAVRYGPARGERAAAGGEGQAASVLEVVDGDTVKVRVDGRVETLRLIGLDTPETVDPRRPVQCFGREASARAKELLPPGTPVRLETDPTQGDRDKYGRLLRYLRLPDGRLFNEVMIAEGYATEYTYRLPHRYQAAFRQAQSDARRADRGLWSPATCGGDRRRPAPPVAAAPAAPPGASGVSGGAPDRSGADPHPAPGAAEVASADPCRPGQIKANRNSGVYHVPRGAAYADVRENVACFDSESAARAAGFRRARR
jgi:micrococcal nuclease